MVVADRLNVGARLIDAAVDDPFAVEPLGRRRHRLGIEREFQNVVRLDQFGAARARHQEATRIGRMPETDVAEGIEDTLVGDDAVGARQFRFGLSKDVIRHRNSPLPFRRGLPLRPNMTSRRPSRGHPQPYPNPTALSLYENCCKLGGARRIIRQASYSHLPRRRTWLSPR